MLYDRSNTETTQVFGPNATPFEAGRRCRVIVQEGLNTILGIGGVNCDHYQSELIWHQSPAETIKKIKRQNLEAQSLWDPDGLRTRSTSPELPIDEQRLRDEEDQKFCRQKKLSDKRSASLPLHQFRAQMEAERKRILCADPRTRQQEYQVFDHTFETEAVQVVKKRWVEQGIWKDMWDQVIAGRYGIVGKWKHEENLEFESKYVGGPGGLFSMCERQLKSKDELIRIAERQVVRGRQREASRPYHQFVYQTSKERQRIEKGLTSGEGVEAADIDSMAHENVKRTWIERGIWDSKWSKLPGMDMDVHLGFLISNLLLPLN
jgi:hypothetical protein